MRLGFLGKLREWALQLDEAISGEIMLAGAPGSTNFAMSTETGMKLLRVLRGYCVQGKSHRSRTAGASGNTPSRG